MPFELCIVVIVLNLGLVYLFLKKVVLPRTRDSKVQVESSVSKINPISFLKALMPSSIGLVLFVTLALNILTRFVLASFDMAQYLGASNSTHKLLESASACTNLVGGFVVMTEWYLTLFKLKYTTNTFEKGIFKTYENSVVIPSQTTFGLIIAIQLTVVCYSDNPVTLPAFIGALSGFMAIGAIMFHLKAIKPPTQAL